MRKFSLSAFTKSQSHALVTHGVFSHTVSNFLEYNGDGKQWERLCDKALQRTKGSWVGTRDEGKSGRWTCVVCVFFRDLFGATGCGNKRARMRERWNQQARRRNLFASAMITPQRRWPWHDKIVITVASKRASVRPAAWRQRRKAMQGGPV